MCVPQINFCSKGNFMSFFDFDSIVINNCSQNFDCDELKNTMNFFKGFGIKQFIVTYDIDILSTALKDIKLNMRNIKRDLAKIRPYACVVSLAPVIKFERSVIQDPSLVKFLFAHSDKLFLRLPEYQPWNYDKWLFQDINELLYKKRYFPIFTNIEVLSENYSPDVAEKLIKTQKATICYDVKFITTRPGRICAIQSMGKRNTGIVLSVNKPIKSYTKIENLMERFKKALGNSTYLGFCKHLNECNRFIFPRKIN